MKNEKDIMVYGVDMQKDFMNKDGALYVPGAEEIKGNIKRIVDAEPDVLVLSGDKHKPGDKELEAFPAHCMDGTEGSKFIKEVENFEYDMTIPKRLMELLKLESPEKYDAIMAGVDDLSSPRWWEHSWLENGIPFPFCILTKNEVDVFQGNDKADDIIVAYRKEGIKRAIIIGVAIEYCVLAAVLGIQKRGIQCFVVTDAIAGIDTQAIQDALGKMTKAGAILVNTEWAVAELLQS